MTKKFQISGTATFQWSKTVAVDDDDDPESYEPVMYLDDVTGHETGDGEVEIESVVEVKRKVKNDAQ